MQKYFNHVLVSVILLFNLPSHAGEDPFILLQSTTSTKNSGLYDYLLPKFKQDSGIDVRVVAVGTGQAIKNASNGDADVLIVHAKSREQEFVAQGYGLERHELMYNDFIIIGPDSDMAGVKNTEKVINALQQIAKTKSIFVSRGDDSGTHIKELSLWSLAGISVSEQSGTWYREAGAGMGATLNTAIGMNGYVITDRATWVSFGNKQNHVIVFEGDPPLNNQYSVIAVNPKKHPHVKIGMVQNFIKWLLSEHGQALIGQYRVYEQQLFFPNAIK